MQHSTEWISVSEKMPPAHPEESSLSVSVLVWVIENGAENLSDGFLDISNYSSIWSGWLDDGMTFEDSGFCITHWMPVPPPPAQEEKCNTQSD